MKLTGENQEIEMRVLGYECPQPRKSYWDNNWLMIGCRKRSGEHEISGSFPCCLTVELARLRRLLKEILDGTRDEFQWGGTEPNLTISLERKENGYALSIFFYLENGMESFDQVRPFQKNASEEEVEMLVRFCDEALTRYPEREIGDR